MNKSIKEAVETLKSHGYKLSLQKLAKLKVKKFRIKRKDIHKFHHWVEWAANTGGRFVVAIAGVDRHSMTFHTLAGYEYRKQHANEIRRENELPKL